MSAVSNVIPVSVSIDVEPDPRAVSLDRPESWSGIEAAVPFLRGLRSRLPGSPGRTAAFAWMIRMDPQIRISYGDNAWGARRYARQFDALRDDGDELGLHTHMYRWDEEHGRWSTDSANEDWCRRCIRESCESFREFYGASARISTCGDRFLSDDVLEEFERQGGEIDMSPEPGMTGVQRLYASELATGSMPDYTGIPNSTWRPSRKDYRLSDEKGGRDLLLVPVSMFRVPTFMELGRRIDLVKRQLKGEEPSLDDRNQKQARICLGHRSYVFRHAVKARLSAGDLEHLSFVLRTSQFLDPAMRRRVEANLTWLAEGVGGHEFRFVSAHDLVRACGFSTGQPAVISETGASSSAA